jgi:hypothetical protein
MMAADPVTVTAGVFIDGSYEGDLLAAAGVSWASGREAAAQYNESLGGRLFVPNHVGGHQFGVPVNYTDGQGGLLPMIYAGDPGTPGQGDDKVQAYNFRMCLTTDPANRVPFTQPAGYDPAYWVSALRSSPSGQERGERGGGLWLHGASRPGACPCGRSCSGGTWLRPTSRPSTR